MTISSNFQNRILVKSSSNIFVIRNITPLFSSVGTNQVLVQNISSNTTLAGTSQTLSFEIGSIGIGLAQNTILRLQLPVGLRMYSNSNTKQSLQQCHLFSSNAGGEEEEKQVLVPPSSDTTSIYLQVQERIESDVIRVQCSVDITAAMQDADLTLSMSLYSRSLTGEELSSIAFHVPAHLSFLPSPAILGQNGVEWRYSDNLQVGSETRYGSTCTLHSLYIHSLSSLAWL